MKYKLVIFDLDGTILNTLQDLTNSTNYALLTNNLPSRSIDEVRNFVGNGITKLIERAVPSKSSVEIIQRVYELFCVHYKEHCFDNTKAYPGVINLLNNLKLSGCKLAVVSNKADFAVQELVNKYFPSIFDFVVGERKGINKKPYPDSVNEVLRVLNVSKNESLYVGDSEVDIETAKNAGLKVVSVTWGFKNKQFLVEHGAYLIIDKAEELLNV